MVTKIFVHFVFTCSENDLTAILQASNIFKELYSLLSGFDSHVSVPISLSLSSYRPFRFGSAKVSVVFIPPNLFSTFFHVSVSQSPKPAGLRFHFLSKELPRFIWECKGRQVFVSAKFYLKFFFFGIRFHQPPNFRFRLPKNFPFFRLGVQR